MWPFDEIMGTLAGFGDQLSALQGIANLIFNIPWQIANILTQILMCLIYPVIVFLTTIQVLVNAAIAPPLTLVNVLITIPNTAITMINILLVGVYPSIWIGLLVSGLLIVLGLRIYAIVKGVSILGFSL